MNKKKSPRSTSPQDAPPEAEAPFEPTARRGFFVRFLAGAISLVLGLIPLGLGLGFFFDPLLRKRRGSDASGAREDAEGFIRLDIGLSALPEDGTPIAYTVHSDKSDAWNRFQDVPIGTVWLRRIESDQVLALSSICPHLGCAVDFRPDNADFFCPCHTSAFNLQGEKTNQIPPRGMDELETRFKPETGDTIWLKYQVFRGSIEEKIPLS